MMDIEQIDEIVDLQFKLRDIDDLEFKGKVKDTMYWISKILNDNLETTMIKIIESLIEKGCE